ncbi:hypothetical protein NDU88_002658 [Pleurodeles waltl]|uniref:Uncharacterized protein n=1 Tax=Pleurodeles waltl TaxID=8319 RepID=A0AAV7QA08_PLEWA|nr:hypothetical protein NDU88_002658 [Pleurodeles waltl]
MFEPAAHDRVKVKKKERTLCSRERSSASDTWRREAPNNALLAGARQRVSHVGSGGPEQRSARWSEAARLTRGVGRPRTALCSLERASASATWGGGWKTVKSTPLAEGGSGCAEEA